MLKNSSGFQTHVNRDIEILYDAELGVSVYVCTDDYICNVTNEEFWVMGSGKTKQEAIDDCSPPTNAESMLHIASDERHHLIDFDRLRSAMDTECYTMPAGFNKDEKRQYIIDCANGLIEPNKVN